MPQFRLAAGLGSPDDQATIIGRDYPIVGNPVDDFEMLGNLNGSYQRYAIAGGTDEAGSVTLGVIPRLLLGDSAYLQVPLLGQYSEQDFASPDRYFYNGSNLATEVGIGGGYYFDTARQCHLRLGVQWEHDGETIAQGGWGSYGWSSLPAEEADIDQNAIRINGQFDFPIDQVNLSVNGHIIPVGSAEYASALDSSLETSDSVGGWGFGLNADWGTDTDWRLLGSLAFANNSLGNNDANYFNLNLGVDSANLGELNGGFIYRDNPSLYYDITQTGISFNVTPDIANRRPFTLRLEHNTLNQGDSETPTSVPGVFLTIDPMELIAPRPEDQ